MNWRNRKQRYHKNVGLLAGAGVLIHNSPLKDLETTIIPAITDSGDPQSPCPCLWNICIFHTTSQSTVFHSHQLLVQALRLDLHAAFPSSLQCSFDTKLPKVLVAESSSECLSNKLLLLPAQLHPERATPTLSTWKCPWQRDSARRHDVP